MIARYFVTQPYIARTGIPVFSSIEIKIRGTGYRNHNRLMNVKTATHPVNVR